MSDYVINSIITCIILCGVFYVKKYSKYSFYIINYLMKKNKQDKMNNFNINDNETSATIKYNYLGSNYDLIVPFDRRYIVEMLQFRVVLDNTKNITQQPGIPYLISAKDLGGKIIEITNEETGKMYQYINDKIPLYGKEVF